MVAGDGGEGDNLSRVKFRKFLFGLGSVVFASIGTLLFQPTVFCGITIPVGAKLAGWKVRAVSAKLVPSGRLEIEGLEAVDKRKSRIAMDSARVDFDPLRLLTGRLEIPRADFRFSLVDLELAPAKAGKGKRAPVTLPFSLREASVELVEGRLRTETGAWIVKSVQASAQGWDGRTPKEIRLQFGRLDWNGPGKQELAATMQATASKSRAPSGEEVWDLKLTTDVNTVADLPPWNLVSPCRLTLEGKAACNQRGEWRMDGVETVWQGVGGIRLAAEISGTYASSGEWTARVNLDPADLQLAGIFLQPRGIRNLDGKAAGTVKLAGGPGKPLGVGIELNGQAVQLAAAGGAIWPAQPAALGISARGEWRGAERVLRMESLSVILGRVGQPEDFQLSLDRPAVFPLAGSPKAEAAEPASLQWSARGLELAAVAPIFLKPEELKVEGGKLSASGQARIEPEKVGLSGRVESRTLTASGRWVQGSLAVQSASLDFQGHLEKATKLHLESGQLKASWEGGVAEDLVLTAKAEWDWARKEGFVVGDLGTGLAGLGKAWSGAKFWPADGQAQAHVEFSGNPAQKGAGLVSVTLNAMRWPEEKTGSWGARFSSDVQVEQGTWSFPEIELQANQAGEPLLDAKVMALWRPAEDTGRVRVELARAESAFVVPLLKNFTPEWQWTEASGKGSFEFTREKRHDLVKADLDASITVETGTPQRPRPVDFSSVKGEIRASWPSGTEGELAVETLVLVAKHRDGVEAVHASLDAPLRLEKTGPGEWKPAGKQDCSGVIEFVGWPMGILTPLFLSEASESSVGGTLSGFLRVRGDPKAEKLSARLELASPDFSVDLPQFRLPENQANLQAEISLGDGRSFSLEKVLLTSREGGVTWVNFSAEKVPGAELSISGSVDLQILGSHLPRVGAWVSSGKLTLDAKTSEPKDGVRSVTFLAEGENLAPQIPGIGPLGGLGARAQGKLDWGKGGLLACDNVDLLVSGPQGNLQILQMDYRKEAALSWESARVSSGWAAVLVKPWISPNEWVGGDLVAGPGFWEPADHGSSGQLDLSLVGVRINRPEGAPLSVRGVGDWEFDKRTGVLVVKDASLQFPVAGDQPVEISILEAGPGLFRVKTEGGVADIRGFLRQWQGWKTTSPDSRSAKDATRLDISAKLDGLMFNEANVGPVKISRLRYGPEGLLLEPSSVEVQGGLIRGSVLQTSGGDASWQTRLYVEKFPVGPILGSMIEDARGPVGGWLDLDFSGQASGTKKEDLQKSLAGQGTFRICQAQLENLPAIAKALRAAGQFLGSDFIASSKINDLAGKFAVKGPRINVEDLQVSGTALAAGMHGWLDWVSQAIDFRVNLALTREAIQSSGQLQSVMTQLIGANTDYYTKIPGSASITGTLSDPKVQMDVTAMLAEGGLNLLLNTPSGVLQGADGATGGLTAPVTAPLQGFFNLLRGN